MISNKQYRVTKQFYKILNDYAKTIADIGVTPRKNQCDEIMTTLLA